MLRAVQWMSQDVEYIGLGSPNVKMRIFKTTVVVGKSFSHRLRETIRVRRKVMSSV